MQIRELKKQHIKLSSRKAKHNQAKIAQLQNEAAK
jgi:hypothetical protein